MIVISSFRQGVECERELSNKEKKNEGRVENIRNVLAIMKE